MRSLSLLSLINFTIFHRKSVFFHIKYDYCQVVHRVEGRPARRQRRRGLPGRTQQLLQRKQTLTFVNSSWFFWALHNNFNSRPSSLNELKTSIRLPDP